MNYVYVNVFAGDGELAGTYKFVDNNNLLTEVFDVLEEHGMYGDFVDIPENVTTLDDVKSWFE